MSNWSDIQMIVGPANSLISQNMNFIREYQQRTQTGQNPYPGSPQQQAPPPGGMPADQAMFYSSMMFQMNQMIGLLGQLTGILRQVQGSGYNLSNAGVTDEQLNYLNGSLGNFLGGGDGALGTGASYTEGQQQAMTYLNQFLKKESHEQNAEDADCDGYVVGEGDVSRLKCALEERRFTKADLMKAFQTMMTKTSPNKLDELLTLCALCEQEDVVGPHTLLRPRLIDTMDETRRNILSRHIADRGLSMEDGKLNNNLASFLLNGVADTASTKMENFTKATLSAMSQKWLATGIAADNPNRRQLVHLMSMIGFKFNADGTLLADAQQPFTLS